jgi:hypothetical protein
LRRSDHANGVFAEPQRGGHARRATRRAGVAGGFPQCIGDGAARREIPEHAAPAVVVPAVQSGVVVNDAFEPDGAGAARQAARQVRHAEEIARHPVAQRGFDRRMRGPNQDRVPALARQPGGGGAPGRRVSHHRDVVPMGHVA